MRTLFLIPLLTALALQLFSQTPSTVKYQAVIRDQQDKVIANQQVTLLVRILHGSATGTEVCTETFTPVTNAFGLVNLELGSVSPAAFAAIDWSKGPFFVSIALNGNEMGTSPLLATPYALYASRSGEQGQWKEHGTDIYFNTGRVGIGTSNPQASLGLRTTDASNPTLSFGNDLEYPGDIRYDVNTTPTSRFRMSHDLSGPTWDFQNLSPAPSSMFYISGTGNVGIGNSDPSARLVVEGRTRTKVLEITGGADLAEPFTITGDEPLPEGTVVVIDALHPGQLVRSAKAYDKRVAGIVSGAGGVRPGLTLNQSDRFENGTPVALSGRVYVLATAANGAIRPGDRLTTSDVPGYAMKATNNRRCPGAVIGKAMSSLESGTGLVMVLVNLQ